MRGILLPFFICFVACVGHEGNESPCTGALVSPDNEKCVISHESINDSITRYSLALFFSKPLPGGGQGIFDADINRSDSVVARWVNNRVLLIDYPADAYVRQKANWAHYMGDSVQIEYQTMLVKKPCSFDQKEFRAKLGLGIFELKISPQPSRQNSLIITNDSDTVELKLFDRPGWELLANDEPLEEVIRPFLYPSFAQHFRFIWSSGNRKSGIYLKSYLGTDSFRVVSNEGFELIPWEIYLKFNYIDPAKDSRVYQDIKSQSKLITDSLPGYYAVEKVYQNWVQIRYLDPSDPAELNPQQALGWMQWYCNDTLQVNFLDDIAMESYYFSNRSRE